jgi:hypothetical protein
MKHMMLSLLLPLFFFHQSDARTKMHRGEGPYLKTGINNQLSARVYFSTQIPIDGIAKESKVFYIDPNGSFAYVIVDNYPSSIAYNKLKVLVYKTINGLPERVDERFYDVDGRLTYTYIKYSFFSTGSYIFDVFSENNTFIGTGKVEILNSTTPISTNPKMSGPRVYFSTQVPIAGIASDVRSFVLQPGGGFVYVVVDNYPNNFNARSLRLFVHRYEGGRYRRVDKRTYDINGDLYYTYFTYTFRLSGDYRFDVYDSKDRFINSGYVTISW